MKIRMTRMVEVLGALSLAATLIACDGSNRSPLAPTTESTQAASSSGSAPNNPANDPAPTTPTNPAPAPPATPVPPAPTPTEPTPGPIEPPAVGPCEVPASQWQIVSFIRSPGSRTLVVRNNGQCADYFGGATFIGTPDNLPAQKRHDGKVVLVQPGVGKEATITYSAPDNGSVCVPVQDDVFRHMSALPAGADYDHFGRGAIYLMPISQFVESSFIDCPKTCVDVEPFLSPVTLTDEGDNVSASVIPEFKSVTLNANQIIIQVIDGDMVVGHPITRDQKGTRVALGKFQKGNAPRTYKVRLRVSDDQAQNCSSNEVTFTVPAKTTTPPPTDACVGVSGSLRYEDGVPQSPSWFYTVIVTLSDGATGMLIHRAGEVPVNNGARIVLGAQRPEPGNGPGKETVQLKVLKNNQQCGSPVNLDVPVPEKDKPVTPPPPPPPPPTVTPLVCTPANQSVTIGQTATFSSSGPNQARSWSAPGGSPSSGTGTGFSAYYNTEGEKLVTVSTEGQSPAVCKVMVSKPVEPPPQSCAEQYPARIDSPSGHAERQGNEIVVTGSAFIQNSPGFAVAIVYIGKYGDLQLSSMNDVYIKDKEPGDPTCGPGKQVSVSFRSKEGPTAQEGGARYQLWVVKASAPLVPTTPQRSDFVYKLIDLPWVP